MTKMLSPITQDTSIAVQSLVQQKEGRENRATQRAIASAGNRTSMANMDKRGQQFREYQASQERMQDKQMRRQEEVAAEMRADKDEDERKALQFALMRGQRTRKMSDEWKAARKKRYDRQLGYLKAKMVSTKDDAGMRHALKGLHNVTAMQKENRTKVKQGWGRAWAKYWKLAADKGTALGMTEIRGKELAKEKKRAQRAVEHVGRVDMSAGVGGILFAPAKEGMDSARVNLAMEDSVRVMGVADSLSHILAQELAKDFPKLQDREGKLKDTLKKVIYTTMEGQGDGTGVDPMDSRLSPALAETLGAGTLGDALKQAIDSLEKDFPEIGLGGVEVLVEGPGQAWEGALGTKEYADHMEFMGVKEKDYYKHLPDFLKEATAIRDPNTGAVMQPGSSPTAQMLKQFGVLKTMDELRGMGAVYKARGGEYIPWEMTQEMEKWLGKKLKTTAARKITPPGQWGEEGAEYFQALMNKIEAEPPMDMTDIEEAGMQRQMELDDWLEQGNQQIDIGQIDTLTAEDFARHEL